MSPEYEEEIPPLRELDSFYAEIADESHDPNLKPVTTRGIFTRYYRPKPPPRRLTA